MSKKIKLVKFVCKVCGGPQWVEPLDSLCRCVYCDECYLLNTTQKDISEVDLSYLEELKLNKLYSYTPVTKGDSDRYNIAYYRCKKCNAVFYFDPSIEIVVCKGCGESYNIKEIMKEEDLVYINMLKKIKENDKKRSYKLNNTKMITHSNDEVRSKSLFARLFNNK